MNSIKYNIFKSNRTYEAAIDEIVGQLDMRCVRSCFFIKVKDNNEYIYKKGVITSALKAKFNHNLPTYSVISQQPLDTEVAVEAHTAIDGEIIYKEGYIVIDTAHAKEIIVSGICGDVKESIKEQTSFIFRRLNIILVQEGAKFSDIVKQWNYIENITHIDDEHQHYQDFNDVRSRYYSQCEWTNGYPAATGIGTWSGGIVIGFDVIVAKSAELEIKAIDNDLQVAAHAYSKGVLIGEYQEKSTPKFERAKSVSTADTNRVYISGTAAILGEESLEGVGFAKQIDITMKNIEHLIIPYTFNHHNIRPSKMQLQLLRVYIKNETDIDVAIEYMIANYPSIPVIYCIADVCREELLVEIEGVALKVVNELKYI